jgi:hypothetical protein
MSPLFASRALAALLVTATASTAVASDGVIDTGNTHPAVGFYYVAYTRSDGAVETLGGCSGTLVAPDVFLTAAHCTFYDTRLLFEDPSYVRTEAWVTFDPIALENDFRCFLRDKRYPGAAASLACDASQRNRPTFLHARSTGITHPAYPELKVLGNGAVSIGEPLTPNNTDLGVLLLDKDVKRITPLATAPLGRLDTLNTSGVTLLAVGYGLAYHRAIPATPEQPGGDGPTEFVSEYGYRRIAQVGTIRSITTNNITPTQQSSQSEDSVCYWDSGSPLFLVRDGVLDRTVSGVLTGAALWCMGAHDPYQRVDIGSSLDFLDCIASAATARDACACGVEDRLGSCDQL